MLHDTPPSLVQPINHDIQVKLPTLAPAPDKSTKTKLYNQLILGDSPLPTLVSLAPCRLSTPMLTNGRNVLHPNITTAESIPLTSILFAP